MSRCARNILGLLMLAVLTAWGTSMADVSSALPAASQPAAVVVLEGQIDNYNRDMLARRFADARAAGAKVVILQINSYGGLVTAGLEISRFIKQQNDLHTIAFVDDKAISAGAMVAMACNEIVMEPASVIGDCAPIMIKSDGSLQPLPDAERGKVESPILADFRDSAQRNGYDPLLAEAMVAVDRVVHYMQSPEGERGFFGADEYKERLDAGWKPVEGVPNPVDGAKELLTVYSDVAAKIGLSKGEFNSPQALAETRGYHVVASFVPTKGEKLLQLLNSAPARGLLITIFIMCAWIAMSTPGHGAPEALAVIALGLIVGVPLLTGYASWWEILLIFVGLALLVFEIFVLPGQFIAGILGAILVLGGLVMTFVPREPIDLPGILPSLEGTYAALERGLIVVVSGLVCSLLLWLWLQRYLPKVPYFRHLVLTTTVGGSQELGAPPAEEAAWPMVGTSGRAVTDLYPGGKAAFFDDALGDERITQVVSEAGFIAAGTHLVVREVAGNRIVVRPVLNA